MSRIRSTGLALSAAILAAVLPSTAHAQATGGRVAYVAVQAVLQRTPGYTEAETTWNKEMEGFQREMTQIQARMAAPAAEHGRVKAIVSGLRLCGGSTDQKSCKSGEIFFHYANSL